MDLNGWLEYVELGMNLWEFEPNLLTWRAARRRP